MQHPMPHLECTLRAALAILIAAPLGMGQTAPLPSEAAPPSATPNAGAVTVEPGTHIPLSLINSASTKHSVVGDRVYLQTVFPIMVGGRIAIPPGSYVQGTVTELKRPGRVKGKGELFLRFDSMTLPNGVMRDFRGRVSAVDARGDETLDRKEGKIEGKSNVAGDLKVVGETSLAGASVGEIAALGSKAGFAGEGALIGAGAGAAAGLLGVLLTRGPGASLARPLVFQADELNFGALQPVHVPESPAPAQKNGLSRPRFPF
jgi:type IV secretion system protein VirB10